MAWYTAGTGETICDRIEEREDGKLFVKSTSIRVEDPDDLLGEKIPEEPVKLEVTGFKLFCTRRAAVRGIDCDYQNAGNNDSSKRVEESDPLAEERREKMRPINRRSN